MKRFLLPFLILLGLSLACGTSSLPPLIGGGTPEPTPIPIPLDQLMSYRVPLYTISLEPGEVVPGTQLEYVGAVGDT